VLTGLQSLLEPFKKLSPTDYKNRKLKSFASWRQPFAVPGMTCSESRSFLNGFPHTLDTFNVSNMFYINLMRK
jgi:hypothetical protein